MWPVGRQLRWHDRLRPVLRKLPLCGRYLATPANETRVVFAGATHCLECTDGYQPTAAQDNCTVCPPGTAGYGGTCSSCPNSSRWQETHVANSNRTECVCVANENCSATNCGMTPDGCGGAIWCDGCSNLVGGVFGYWCNQSLHECMSEPDTCAVLGATGGIASDGFGGLLSCGGCPELNAWGSNFSCTGAN